MRKSGTMTQILAQYGHLIGRETVGWNGCPCACHNPENDVAHDHVCCLPTRGEFDRFKSAIKKIEDEEEREKAEKMVERIDLVFKTNGHISADWQRLPIVATGTSLSDPLVQANIAFVGMSSMYSSFNETVKQRNRRPVKSNSDDLKLDIDPFDAPGNFDEGDAFDF